MHPVLTRGAGGDDEFFQLLVLVVLGVLGLGTAGHDSQHLVEHLVQLGRRHIGTVLRHTHVGSLLTLRRCPAGDADLLGQALLQHDTLEVLQLAGGVELLVHGEIPIQFRRAVKEVDVGSLHNALCLVVVHRRNGDVALDIHHRGCVVHTVRDEHRAELLAVVVAHHILCEAGVLVGHRSPVAYRVQHHASRLHARLEVEHVAVGEAAAVGIVNDGAVAIHLLTLQGHGLQRYVATFPAEHRLEEHHALLVEIFLGNGTGELHHHLVIHRLHGIRVGSVANFIAVRFHFVQSAAACQQHGEEHKCEKSPFHSICILMFINIYIKHIHRFFIHVCAVSSTCKYTHFLSISNYFLKKLSPP